MLAMRSIEHLPVELQHHIMSLVDGRDLCTMATVCKAWYPMTLPAIYHTLDFKTNTQLEQCVHASDRLGHAYVSLLALINIPTVPDALVKKMACYPHPNLRTLNLSNCKDVSSDTIEKLLGDAAESLEQVILSNCMLSQAILDLVGCMSRHRLWHLNLSNCMIKPCNAIDMPDTLETVWRWGSGNITHLDLSYCAWVNGDTLKHIAQCMPMLEYLNLCWCNQLLATMVSEVIPQLRHLQVVDLRYVSNATSEWATSVLDQHPHVQTIQFTDRRKQMQVIRTHKYHGSL